MFSLFEDECTVISADNKAKVGVGIPCVHRLTNIRHKFFIKGSGPNFAESTDDDWRPPPSPTPSENERFTSQRNLSKSIDGSGDTAVIQEDQLDEPIHTDEEELLPPLVPIDVRDAEELLPPLVPMELHDAV